MSQKQHRVKLLTQKSGIIDLIILESEVEQETKRVIEEHGTFTTLSSCEFLDLFEHYELLPPDAMAVYEKYSDFEDSYEECANMLADFEAIGYTFDYYLDAQPYNLRKI